MLERALGLRAGGRGEPELGRAVCQSISDEAFPGFLESFLKGRPSRDGNAIPWLTFPAIAFLDRLPLQGKTVLEVGAGSSTIYWAQRGMTGCTIEANEDWAVQIRRELNDVGQSETIGVMSVSSVVRAKSTGTHLTTRELEAIRSLERLDPDHCLESYLLDDFVALLLESLDNCDLLVIDGVLRNLTAVLAASRRPSRLKWIIFDNSDREMYTFGRVALSEAGWLEIPFVGLSPGNAGHSTTSIFLPAAV